MTDNARMAGSGTTPEPAREQVVIRDKRKIDASGRPTAGGAGQAEAAAAAQEAAQTAEARDNATRQAAPGDGGPENTGPENTGSENTGPRSTGPENAAPQEAAPENAAPDLAEQGSAAREQATEADPDASTVEAPPTDDSTAESPAAGGTGPTESGAAGVATPPALGAELEALRHELDERVRDLQRIGAEYANYRKRVERDRAAAAEQATAAVVGSLLPILDDIDRARDHGDLAGPFAAVAEQLVAALNKFGLTGFGEVGDPFDPMKHEAVTHEQSSEVTEPTCVTVMRRGYQLGDRLLRAAMVGVADPE